MTPQLAAFESARDRLPVGTDFDTFMRAMHGFHFEPVLVDGALAGAIATRGAEIHACILPHAFSRWARRGLWQKHLAPILEAHGHAITHVTAGNAVGEEFVLRLGFKFVHEKDGTAEYRLEAKSYGH